MASVILNDISISFGDRRIFESVNFSITPGQKIALCGANGSGKSTLFKILAGQMESDAGKVVIEKNTRLSYLPQTGIALAGCTVREEVEKAFRGITPLAEELKTIEESLGSAREGDETTDALLTRHHHIQERIINSEYYSRDVAVSKVIRGLGFMEKDFDRNVSSFSGGWQMRIALARVLLERPDILLLDEPTNYLDMEARNWLESFLRDFTGGFLIVSHDRFFLDVTVNQVMEIYQRRITSYKGNYSQYEEKRAVELVTIIDAYDKQQDEISKIETFIKRFRYNSSKAKVVQSRVKYLEKLDRIEKPPGFKMIHLNFPPSPHSGRITVTVEELSKSYGNNIILEDISFELERGEKLVLVGSNGAGKSTLMNILAGQLSYDNGSVKYGKDVDTGYFSQDGIDKYVSDRNVIEEVEEGAPTELIPRLRNLLGAFLFSGDDIYKSFSVLSGGEKNRIALLKLLLHPANLLLLDEPTNHLDMVSKNILLEALKKYNGSLVFVSHDRYFIEKLATKVLEVDSHSGAIRIFQGDYNYYLWKKEGESALEEEAPEPEKEISRGKIAREEEKKTKRVLNKLIKEEKLLLARLEKLDSEYKSLEKDMGKEKNYLDGEKMKQLKEKIDSNRKENGLLLNDWEDLELQLEEIRSK